MWRILAACLLAATLVAANHDGADHHHHEKDEDKKESILEIEPNVNSKDKRSPQHGSSQAVYGASPGQFVVRTSSPSEEPQPQIPPEYLSLLQQLVAQQTQQDGAQTQTPSQPLIQQLLVARNPDPSAVQFASTPGQAPPRRRPPPSPQAQLQQLYFNQQFQQQIPLRPRILRPRPRPSTPSADTYSGLTTSSQVYDLHEARLRASLAGSDPNLAAQALSHQQVSTGDSPSLVYDQQLAQLATATQEELAQTLPQQVPQQETAYTINSQVKYDPEPQQIAQREVSYANRQAPPSQQLILSERVKPSRRPPAPEQYLRETTQPLQQQQTVVQIPQRQQTAEPTVYLSSQSGQQTPSTSQNDDIIAQLLSQQDRGLFPSSTPSAASLAEEVIKSTTALPPTASRSSIYVTQTSNVKSPGKITIDEVGPGRDNSETLLPVVHLPTPDGQRPITQNEFQALLDAGFKISPAPESPEDTGALQTVAPEYYRPTTKKQRSYATPAPPQRNQVLYQSRQKAAEQEKEDARDVASPEVETVQQRGQVSRYQLQGTKPQHEEEELVQYIRRPETQTIPQGGPVTRLQYVTNKPEQEEQIIQFIQIPTTPQVPDVRQRGQYQPDATLSAPQQTQLHRLQEEREILQQQVQTSRYQPEPQEPRYQTETAERLQQQTPSYRHEEESLAQEIPSFHPIIVAELPTTPSPSPVPRRRRPRPNHSRVVYRQHPTGDQTRTQEASAQYLVSYDSIPEATSFGTRNTRVRGRRPSSDEES